MTALGGFLAETCLAGFPPDQLIVLSAFFLADGGLAGKAEVAYFALKSTTWRIGGLSLSREREAVAALRRTSPPKAQYRDYLKSIMAGLESSDTRHQTRARRAHARRAA